MGDTITIGRKGAVEIVAKAIAEYYGFGDEARTHSQARIIIAALEVAALRSDDGWVTVSEEHPLPDDLKPGDYVKHGSATLIIIAVEVRDGQPQYLFDLTDFITKKTVRTELSHFHAFRRRSSEGGG